MITKIRQQALDDLQNKYHQHCLLCGSENQVGLKLTFKTCDDGSVESKYWFDQDYQGYQQRLHGGVISALVDSAMTNCLFSYGKVGVTAELKVRYKCPVKLGQLSIIKAWIEKDFSKLIILNSALIQDQESKVIASGKFIEIKDKL